MTMINDHGYRCLLSPRDVMALEQIADDEWTAIAWSHPERQAGLRIRCDRLQICAGNSELIIGVRTVDLEPKLEAFRLVAGNPSDWPQSSRSRPTSFEDSDELMSAFIGKSHRLFIGAREHSFTAGDVTRSFLVEDVLVLRHHSGQQVYVCPDDDLPGSVVVSRDRQALPFPGAVFSYLRAL
jgi:hypothetical protein